MNYNSVILVGILAVSGLWWLVHATHHYPGPRVMQLYIHADRALVSSTGIEEVVSKEGNAPINFLPLP